MSRVDEMSVWDFLYIRTIITTTQPTKQNIHVGNFMREQTSTLVTILKQMNLLAALYL